MNQPLYEYRVLSRGNSSFSFLEGMASNLTAFLNDAEVESLQKRGWELFQVNTLNDKQGNNGFLLIFRRAKTQSKPFQP